MNNAQTQKENKLLSSDSCVPSNLQKLKGQDLLLVSQKFPGVSAATVAREKWDMSKRLFLITFVN